MLKKPYNLEKQKFGLNNHLTWDNIRTTNIDWWKKVGKSDPKEKPETKRANYDFFLNDIKNVTGLQFDNVEDKIIGEISVGPYGGIIECYKMNCKEKYFIDIFMNDFRDMNYVDWTSNSHFINAPAEHIHLEDNSLDILFGYNSIDHGWDWIASIDECLRISKSMFLMFDTKDEIDGDFHPQKISHQDVIDYVEKHKWSEKFQHVTVKPQLKNYGYYEVCFDWPETWVYVIK